MRLARLAAPATLSLALLSAALAVHAQQPGKVYRIGTFLRPRPTRSGTSVGWPQAVENGELHSPFLEGGTPMDATMLELMSRVARLESRTRRVRQVTGVGAVVLAAVALMGQGPPSGASRSVEAERFVLRDRAGTVRASLEVDRFDIAQLSLFDRSGQHTAKLWVSAEGATGLMLDERQRPGGALADMTAGSLRIGQVWRGFIALQAATDDPSLRMVGKQSEAVLGRTELTRTRTGGTEILPAGSLVFFDKDGKVTWKAP